MGEVALYTDLIIARARIADLEAERDALRNSRLTDGERWTLMAAAILLDNAGCDETAAELRAIAAKEPK